MDLSSIAGIVGAIVGVCTVAGSAFAFWAAWGKINQRVDDQADTITELRKDVDRAQESAGQVKGLADAIEHMGQSVAKEIAHHIEVTALQNRFVNEQLADIKTQLNGSPSRRRAVNG